MLESPISHSASFTSSSRKWKIIGSIYTCMWCPCIGIFVLCFEPFPFSTFSLRLMWLVLTVSSWRTWPPSSVQHCRACLERSALMMPSRSQTWSWGPSTSCWTLSQLRLVECKRMLSWLWECLLKVSQSCDSPGDLYIQPPDSQFRNIENSNLSYCS